MRPILLIAVAALVACSGQKASGPGAGQAPARVDPERFQAGETTVNVPMRVGAWKRSDAARRITADTIFDYMDGAGELYLAYRFDHLDVFEYKAGNESAGAILLELYSMKASDDAFGLLSGDWSGEVPAFDQQRSRSICESCAVPPRAALYGAGLLRMWAGRLYARILAARETPASRDAVLALARGLADEPVPLPRDAPVPLPRPPSPPPHTPPALLNALPERAGALVIRPDRTCFFRSHLVLNSQYFLASEDILGLGLDVEAATTEYRSGKGAPHPLRAILVRYPNEDRAHGALGTFVKAYLPEANASGGVAPAGAAKTEKGWVSWRRQGQDLVITLDAPTAASARELAASIRTTPPPSGSSRE